MGKNDLKCEVCGKNEGRIFSKDNKFGVALCIRHYNQMFQCGEILSKTRHSPNEFIINGEIAEMVLYNKEYIEIARTLIDTSHIKLVKKYKWHLNNNGYVRTSIDGKKTGLHRFVCDAYGSCDVDHINHNKLDNRLSNLRICTRQENNCNRTVSSNNISKHKGVYLTKSGKWTSRIQVNGKAKFLGTFDSKELAISARECADIKYHGEFAYKHGGITEND